MAFLWECYGKHYIVEVLFVVTLLSVLNENHVILCMGLSLHRLLSHFPSKREAKLILTNLRLAPKYIYIVCMIGKSYIGISMTQAEKYFIFLYYRNSLSKT